MPKPPRLDREQEAARRDEALRLEEQLGALGREQALAHRRLLETLLDLQRAEVDLGRGEFTAVGASMVLSVTEHRAQALLAEGHRLAELDRGLELLDLLTVEQVRALLDAVEGLDVELADRVVDIVRDKVTVTGAGCGRRWISDAARRARQRIAPKLEDKRRRRAAADRKVTVHPLADGQAALWIEGPQAAITAMQVAIRDRVAADGGDWFRWEDRTLDARRFDAVTALIAEQRHCTCPTRPTLWAESTGTVLAPDERGLAGAAGGARPGSPTGSTSDTGAGGAVGAVGAVGGAVVSAAGDQQAGAAPDARSVQCGGRGAQPGAGCCSGHGARPEAADLPVITVLIPLATALGQSDTPATRLPSQRAIPGGSALAGPVGAIEARELLRSDVLIRALAIDPATGQPTGQPSPTVRPHHPARGTPPRAEQRRAGPLDDTQLHAVLHGLRQWVQTSPLTQPATEVAGYTVPAAMKREVRARSVTCEFPGCLMPAERCDLDHDIPWPLGPTVGSNLGALCRRHHRVKQTGWTKTRHDDGTVTWTSPTGRTTPRPSWHPTPEALADATKSDHNHDGATVGLASTATASSGAGAPDAVRALADDPWDTTPEGEWAYDPALDDPFTGTPTVDPSQLIDPLSIPTPDDPHPDGDRYSHGRATTPHDNPWAWIDDPTHDLPHPAEHVTEHVTEPPADWTPTA